MQIRGAGIEKNGFGKIWSGICRYRFAVEIATTGCCPFEQVLICPRLEKLERYSTERLGNINMTIYREIEFTAISAHDLRDVRHFGGKMSPYVVAWINPAEKVASREDSKAGIAPEWNAKLRLVADESLVFDHEEEVVIHVEIHDYSTQGKIIGSLSFNLSQLPGKASQWRGAGEAIFMSLPVSSSFEACFVEGIAPTSRNL